MNSDWDRGIHVAANLREGIDHTIPMYEDHIIITPVGPYVVRREDFFVLSRPARPADFANLFRGLEVMDQLWPGHGVMKLERRVPWGLLLQATYFFREVWQQHKREDVLLLYYFFEEERYDLVHPPLKDAGWHHVRYEFPDTPAEAVRFGSFHLHGDEEAYHSSTDRRDDEASPGLHVVIGNLNKSVPTLVCVGSDGTQCVPVSPYDVFEPPIVPVYPADWLIKDVPTNRRSSSRGSF